MELIIALVLFVGMIAVWIALPGQTEFEQAALIEETAPASSLGAAGSAAV